MSFANSYVRDPIVAEDIYVESMMQYWEKRTELPTDINVPAYILTSVKNRALNYLRHLGVRTEVEAQLYEHQTRELNFRISSLESCDPSELFTTEVRDIIRNTLKELPEQTRLIFVKSRFEKQNQPGNCRRIGYTHQNHRISYRQSLETFSCPPERLLAVACCFRFVFVLTTTQIPRRVNGFELRENRFYQRGK